MPVVSTRWLANHWRRRQFHRLTVVTERHVFVVEPHAPFSQRWPVINTLRNGQSRLTSVLAIAPNFLVVRRPAGSEWLNISRTSTHHVSTVIVLRPLPLGAFSATQPYFGPVDFIFAVVVAAPICLSISSYYEATEGDCVTF